MQLAPLCHRLRNPRLPRCNLDDDDDEEEEENDAHEHDDTMMMRMRTMLRR